MELLFKIATNLMISEIAKLPFMQTESKKRQIHMRITSLIIPSTEFNVLSSFLFQ